MESTVKTTINGHYLNSNDSKLSVPAETYSVIKINIFSSQ